MATAERRNRSQKPQKPDHTPMIIALLATLPAIITAIVELLKAGHAIGWW